VTRGSGARVRAPRSSSRSLGPWPRGRARSTRARMHAPRSSSRALGPWLRGRARSTRFRSRSRPSLGGAGTRLRMRCSCRHRDSQSRAAQGHSVAADGAAQRSGRVAASCLPCGRRGTGARHAATKGSDGREKCRRPTTRTTKTAAQGAAASGQAMVPDTRGGQCSGSRRGPTGSAIRRASRS
jgi:hypothetical protein